MKRRRVPLRQPRGPRATLPPVPPRPARPGAFDVLFGSGCQDCNRWLDECVCAARCPCGHDMGSDLRCLNGRVYGPCESEHCDGPCTDSYGFCNADGCLCEETTDAA